MLRGSFVLLFWVLIGQSVSAGDIFRDPFSFASQSSRVTVDSQVSDDFSVPSLLMFQGVIWEEGQAHVLLSYKSRSWILSEGMAFYGRILKLVTKDYIEIVGVSEGEEALSDNVYRLTVGEMVLL